MKVNPIKLSIKTAGYFDSLRSYLICLFLCRYYFLRKHTNTKSDEHLLYLFYENLFLTSYPRPTTAKFIIYVSLSCGYFSIFSTDMRRDLIGCW